MTAPFVLAGANVRTAAVLAALTWLPLLGLTWLEGSAISGVEIPFIGDFVAYGRYLVALPLLLLVHPLAEKRITGAIAVFDASGLAPPAMRDQVAAALARADALWRHRGIRVAMLAASVAFAALAFPVQSQLLVSSWVTPGETQSGHISLAGWWNLLVSGPIVRFLMLLALWKLATWALFLRRIAALPLRYQALHPDRCGGIGFLERAQGGFAALAAAASVQLGCLFTDAVVYQGIAVSSIRVPAIACGALIFAILYAPLTVFFAPLARAGRESEARLSAWASQATRQVETAIRQTDPDAVAARLSTQDLPVLASTHVLYPGAIALRALPIGQRSLRIALLAIVLPFCLPLLPLLPLGQIARRLIGIVI